ncbi:MAG: MFS transporter, partial [Acidimicrobiia bacterium]|nr:MFS transporter [Acidimicrobiia bacterium]
MAPRPGARGAGPATGRVDWRGTRRAGRCGAAVARRRTRRRLRARGRTRTEPIVTRRPFGLDRTVLLLAGTHFCVDGFGNVYAPLLPLLILKLDLSLAAAGVLQMCFQMASSVSQLGFGQLADRWKPRLLLIGGPVVSVAVLSLVGLADSVWTLGAVLVVGGLGGAAFHPPAAALVHRLSGERRGLGMSFHITAGSFGFALGPVAFAPAIERLGLAWTPLFALPGLLALAVCLRHMPRFDALHEHDPHAPRASLRPYAKPLTLLYLIVVLRTLTALAFSTFVPVLLTRRGMSVGQAGVVAAVYLLATSAGGFLGGALADRIGARRIIMLSLALSVPFLAAAPLLTGWLFVVVLSIGGFLLQSTLPVNVTFAQTIAPVSAATVSSLMMGFAWGTSGMSVPLIGLLADRSGIEGALIATAVLPLVAA